MGYSSRSEVIQALANALSQGTPGGTLVPITSIGKDVTDTVSDAQINQYIMWADENIDAWISSVYQVPLTRINRGTFRLGIDATAGDGFLILQDATRFTIDDVIVVNDDINSQQVTVTDVPSDTRLEFTPVLLNSYLALGAKVERIRYPDPIPKVSARLAAAYLYDKHFAAQVEGNESEYGKYLRKLAYQDINRIMDGSVRLLVTDANDLMGRRYWNHALGDVRGTAAEPGKNWLET